MSSDRNINDDIEILNAQLNELLAELEMLSLPYFKKWEYKIIDDIDDVTLVNLGLYGWELVNQNSYSVGGGVMLDGIGTSKYTVHFRYIFKRELPNDNSPEATHLRNSIQEYRTKISQLRHDDDWKYAI